LNLATTVLYFRSRARDRAAFGLWRKGLSRAGFTLVEILMVVIIISLLMTVSVPMYSFLRHKAGDAGCISHLRILGIGLNGYLLDHENIWPQVPESLLLNEEEEMKWWVLTLKTYGIEQKYLYCPSDEGAFEKQEEGPDRFVGSYVITTFDEFPGTAFRWNHPWAIERGSFHDPKVGPNMFMPDGSVVKGMSLTPP
jgi:prepilin-type N-terminal cleavage/methylation domain-containing protein